MNDQHYHVQAVKSLMLSIKESFFAHVGNHGSVSIVDTMLQHCMLERVLLSPVDAVYCTQFALLFNELDVSRNYLLTFFLLSSYLASNTLTFSVTFICLWLVISIILIDSYLSAMFEIKCYHVVPRHYEINVVLMWC